MNKGIGGVGLVAAILWAVGIGLQFSDQRKSAAVHQAGEVLIWIGFLGMAVLVVGMLIAGLAGRGAFAKIALGILVFGLASIPIGGIVEGITGNADNPFYPLGGLGQILGGLATSIVIARAGVLRGWRRWTPLGWFVTYVGVFATFFGDTDNWSAIVLLPFALWLAAIAATALGVATTPARHPGQPVTT